ncbi:MAG TPA: M48 family metalloprotease [Candidatus Aminicenantes bacterium]|nr:M48 family metalloprotease [Candidatus Aminicenantes bacterium]
MSRTKIAALALLALAAACAVNPVSGKKEFMLFSEGQEIELGKSTDAEVAATYGVYDDPALQAYVGKLGAALAAKGQRPGLPWRFTVLDSPVVNAFAVPGGAIYVTRGILAMMNSEAELAAVLGHEIGHVNARHSMSQMSKQQAAAIGLALGSAISRKFAQYAGLAGTGLQVLFLKFSRDNENEADALGVDYARAAGYDPADMAATFVALQRIGDLSGSGAGALPGFLSTHPLTPDRIAHVRAMLKSEDRTLARRPEAYLRAVENIVYGEDPRQGYVEDGVFHHPGLRFRFAVPAGWAVNNMASRIVLVSADQNAGVIMQGGKTADTAEEFARKQAARIAESGGTLLDEGRTTVNGLACYEQAFRIAQENAEPLRMNLSCVKKGDWVYAFQAMSSANGFPKYAPAFKAVVTSFRDLTDASKIDRAPKRLVLVKADGRDTLQAIFRRAGLPEKSWPQFAVWNAMEATDVPAAGRLVKVAR